MTCEYALYDAVQERYVHVPHTTNQGAVWSAGHNSTSTFTEDDVSWLEGCFESGDYSPFPEVCREHRDWMGKVITLVAEEIASIIKYNGVLLKLWVVVVEDGELCFGHKKTSVLGLYGTGIMKVLSQAIMESEGITDDTILDDPPKKYIQLTEEMIRDGIFRR